MHDAPSKPKANDLEYENIQLRNDLLRLQISNQTYKEESKLSYLWSGGSKLLITLLSIAGGLWGFIFPINEYLDQRQKELDFQLNGLMYESIGKLSASNSVLEKSQAILTLTYYSKDAVPILLHSLKSEGKLKKIDGPVISMINQTLSDIFEKSNPKERKLISELLMDSFYHMVHSEMRNENKDDKNVGGMVNYCQVIARVYNQGDRSTNRYISERLEAILKLCKAQEIKPVSDRIEAILKRK